MKLTGDAAKEFMEKEKARVDQLEAETLTRAKADAVRRGKQPFDLEKLESLCDTSNEGRMAPLEQRFAKFEWEYYVVFPTIMTVEEFARKVDELSRW